MILLLILSATASASIAYLSGYWHGRRVEQQEWMEKTGPELERLEQIVVLREMMMERK